MGLIYIQDCKCNSDTIIIGCNVAIFLVNAASPKTMVYLIMLMQERKDIRRKYALSCKCRSICIQDCICQSHLFIVGCFRLWWRLSVPSWRREMHQHLILRQLTRCTLLCRNQFITQNTYTIYSYIACGKSVFPLSVVTPIIYFTYVRTYLLVLCL